jgi:hypothetical protein
MIREWRIKNTKNQHLYWNNQLGWTGILYASIFSDAEKDKLNLPVDGKWERIPLA